MININQQEILETIHMIEAEHLDIRTITMGISLLDCQSEDTDRLLVKIYDKITTSAEKLVETGENTRPGRTHGRHQLYRRLQRAGRKGLHRRSESSDRERPAGTFRDRAGLFFCERGIH